MFDKYKTKSEENVGTGRAEMFLAEAVDHGEDGKGSFDSTEGDCGGDEIHLLRKKKRKAKDEYGGRAGEPVEAAGGYAASHAKNDENKYKEGLKKMQTMLVSVKAPMTAAVGRMARLLKTL